ncbi:hypothetical protein CMI48_00755 [Candidatus Pacearchaeota archaeon]|nr:hypothetical protein [Candidatus Pacearchaeota archaeon]
MEADSPATPTPWEIGVSLTAHMTQKIFQTDKEYNEKRDRGSRFSLGEVLLYGASALAVLSLFSYAGCQSLKGYRHMKGRDPVSVSSQRSRGSESGLEKKEIERVESLPHLGR